MGLFHHHHDHGPGHPHGDHCGHDHGPATFGRAFAIGIGLNVALVGAQILFGLLAHSMALLADAGHNLGDVLGLALSWGATWLAARHATARYTYGLQSGSILAALANVIILLVAVGAIAWESAIRLFHPVAASGGMVMAVALFGIIVNGATALLFAKGKKGDINIRAAFAHMLADAAISVGVVISGLLILLTGWQWIDPAMSLLISGLIVAGSWSLLRDSLKLALQAAPAQIEPGAIKAWLAARPGVAGIHDLHIWAMSTTETALTAHLLMHDHPPAAFLTETTEALRREHGIGHATLQIEVGESAESCRLAHHAA